MASCKEPTDEVEINLTLPSDSAYEEERGEETYSKDGSTEHRVKRPEGGLVGGGERDGELLGRLGQVVSETDAGELETSTRQSDRSVSICPARKRRRWKEGETNRVSQRRPSVAVRPFSPGLPSLATRAWRVAEEEAWVLKRVRTFCDWQEGGADKEEGMSGDGRD
jgi:hypothetical protein